MRKSDTALAKYKDKADAFAKSVNKKFGTALNVVGAGITGVIVAGAKDALNFDKILTQLYVSSAHAMGTTDEMRASFLRLSETTGVAKEELVAATQAYVALTGDGAGATKAVETFARVATASSSSIDDISGAAAALTQQFGIMPADMEQAFSILIAGGKAGKIELKDMAALTASLGASFKQFSGSQGLGGAASLGALFQLTAKDFGSASEAATGLERLMSNIQAREFDLADAGIKVRVGGKKGKGEFKDLVSIVKLLDEYQSKDAKGFNDAFGDNIIAKKALTAISDNIDQVESLTESTRNAKDVAIDLATVQQSASFRAAASWNKVKVAIANAFTPERVESIAKSIESITGVIIKVIDAVGGVNHAVFLLIATWTALKAVQLAGAVGGIIGMVGKLAGVAGGAGSAMGVLAAQAALVVGTAAAAVAVGTGIAHALDLYKGDSGYNNDYRDPLLVAQKKKNREARQAAAVANGGTLAPGTVLPGVPPVNVTIYASSTEAKELARTTALEVVKGQREAELRAAQAATGGSP